MKRLSPWVILVALLVPFAIAAAPAVTGAVQKQPLNMTAVYMFLIFVGATLGITYWAAKRTRTAREFYTAGGGITGFQNGLGHRRRLHVRGLLPGYLRPGVRLRL